MILTSKHSFKDSNFDKQKYLSIFIDEYRRVSEVILNSIWDEGYKGFNISLNELEFPKYPDYRDFEVETFLTARALSSLVNQLSGIIRAAVEKQRKRIFVFNKKKENEIAKNEMKHLILKLKQNIPRKPNIKNINPELSSKCMEFIRVEGHFNGFIKLQSIIKSKKPIYLPIKFHKHSLNLQSKGYMLGGFGLTKCNVSIRWNIKEPILKPEGIIVGADQGLKTVLTLSDKQTTQETDLHGHSLNSIITKMTKTKKGSIRFKRLQDQRTNFINWSINRLDFSGIKQINLERIWNIGYKNGVSRKLSHWTNTVIRDKVEKRCSLAGVQFTEQDSTYRSQRCHCCGMVRKANRKGKTYSCNSCGFIGDADLNAAMNHEISIPEIPYTLRIAKYNRAGFYWTKDGFYDLAGTSLESVPPVEDV